MKKTIFFLLLSLLAVDISAQRLRRTYDAADYYSQDTTTFFINMGSKQDVSLVIMDFTSFNANDAVATIGYGRDDHHANYKIDVSGNPYTLNTADATLTYTANYATVAYTTNAIVLTDIQWRGDILAITIVWNSVTDGNLEIWW
jgi:hypothetical protein